jgi:pseudaminic acid biosynthesis-associated methylase
MGKETEQEQFWRGDFGNTYVDRCRGDSALAARFSLWAKILQSCGPIESITEFGANIGLNLQALHGLVPGANLHGVEINAKAAEELRALGYVDVQEGSLLDTAPATKSDLSFTCTVLIHINPDALPRAYAQIAGATKRYAVICEYYNPTPVEIGYRGHTERLFKRDFAGEFMDVHPEFHLRDYGFAYHRDPNFPMDDFSWFLMERE